ncbi:MAG: DUF2007 domain-containing protein [Candidatus Omnitrophota bacterium]
MKLVKVYSSISLNEVYFVKSILESCEIESVVFDESLAAFAPHYLFHQGGARLMVREEDVQEAAAVVRDYEQAKKEGS